ncbi:SCR11-like protein, partial [Mya arenaria]
MPSYKLTYFNGRGRGELSRLLFAAAGKAFEDNRIEFANWGGLKKDTPQGTLPVLEIDGKRKISQSLAIARFLAREFSKYPGLYCYFAKKREEFLQGKAKTFLECLEKLVKEGGKGDFAVGSSLTIADLMLYAYIENSQCVGILKDFKLLDANRKKVEQQPKIKEYLAKRPGRAEVSRLLLAAAGKAFEDVRVDFAQWGDLKKDMPQGTLPVLEVDGKMKISQSGSIARYLAREF